MRVLDYGGFVNAFKFRLGSGRWLNLSGRM